MPIKPQYERVSLDELGYSGGWVEVRINPTQREMNNYIKAQTKASMGALAILQKKKPEGQPDNEVDFDELAKAIDAADFERSDFVEARVHLLGKCQIDGEQWDLSTVEGYRAFEDEGDPQVLGLAEREFNRRRSERLTKAADSFRGTDRVSAALSNGTSGQAAAS